MLRTRGSARWLVVNDDGVISLLGEKRPELIDQSAAHKGTRQIDGEIYAKKLCQRCIPWFPKGSYASGVT